MDVGCWRVWLCVVCRSLLNYNYPKNGAFVVVVHFSEALTSLYGRNSDLVIKLTEKPLLCALSRTLSSRQQVSFRNRECRRHDILRTKSFFRFLNVDNL